MGTDYHIWTDHNLNFHPVESALEELSRRRGLPYIFHNYNNEPPQLIPEGFTGIAADGPGDGKSLEEAFQQDPGISIDIYENGEEIESYWFTYHRVLIQETDRHPLWLGSRWSGFHTDITARYFWGMEKAFADLPGLTAFLGSTEVLVVSDARKDPCFEFDFACETIGVSIPEILHMLRNDPAVSCASLGDKGEAFIPEYASYYNLVYHRALGSPDP